MTLTVYHSPMMRSLRVIWLLEEMGITDYDLKLIPRADVYDFAKTPEYQAVNPLAKFPAITDGDLTMVESTAIMEYLLDKYGDHGLVPERGTPDYGRYLQWLHFGESGMGHIWDHVICAYRALAGKTPSQRRCHLGQGRNR